MCKHQVACSEMHSLKLSQVFHSTPANRQLLVRIALGDKDAPPLEFFVDLKDEDVPVNNDNSCLPAPTTNTSKESVADPSYADSEDSLNDFVVSKPNRSSSTTDEKQGVIQLLSEAFERFSDGLSSSAVTAMATQLRSLKTANQLNSSMLMFAASSSVSLCRRGKIHCQPTSVARRKVGTPRGYVSVGKGRKRTKTALSNTARKRTRNLSHNIASNQPNAKSHG